jgi:hypothetical protein
VSDPAPKNLPALPGLPLPEDTANLRFGPDLSPQLLGLLPLVGVWRGEGEAHEPGRGDYRFGQQIVVAHDGGDYLTWESRSWRIDQEGNYAGPDAREAGYWRISANDDIELVLTHASGAVEVYYGRPRNQISWELGTDVVVRTSSGSASAAAKRLYGIVSDAPPHNDNGEGQLPDRGGGDLAYVEERGSGDGEFSPSRSARLRRFIG